MPARGARRHFWRLVNRHGEFIEQVRVAGAARVMDEIVDNL